MLNPDKKKFAALIVAKAKPEAKVAEPSEAMEGGEGLQSCGEEILKAIEEKDSGALVGALKAFFEMVDEDEVSEQSEEE